MMQSHKRYQRVGDRKKVRLMESIEAPTTQVADLGFFEELSLVHKLQQPYYILWLKENLSFWDYCWDLRNSTGYKGQVQQLFL